MITEIAERTNQFDEQLETASNIQGEIEMIANANEEQTEKVDDVHDSIRKLV